MSLLLSSPPSPVAIHTTAVQARLTPLATKPYMLRLPLSGSPLTPSASASVAFLPVLFFKFLLDYSWCTMLC